MTNFKGFTNQHKILVNYTGELLHKEGQKNPDGSITQFCQAFNWEPMMDVMSVLSGNEFKIYMYILKWAGSDQYYFSPADIDILLDIGESTAQKTKKRFIDLGILEQINKTTFKFIPIPEKLKEKANLGRAQRILERESKKSGGLQ